MKMSLNRVAGSALLGGAMALLATHAARAGDDPWPDIRAAVFGDRAIVADDGSLSIEAPAHAEDAAVVPVTIRLAPLASPSVTKLTLIVDKNPAPVAATFTFGSSLPKGERVLSTRIRVDSFSKVRAIAETKDGRLLMTSKFVAGAGGCSAPAAKDADAALAEMGKMQIKSFDVTDGGGDPTGVREAIVMVRHPNFTGMQRDAATGGYTPAKFVNQLVVKSGDGIVLEMEGGISISENPHFRFTYADAKGQPLTAMAKDTEGSVFAGRAAPPGS